MTDKQSEAVIAVAREQIRAITSVDVDGEMHVLGQQRDFRRHAELAGFLPETGRPSFAWVRLRDGETLDVHEHPTKSMILVCRGSVELTGDLQRRLGEGDVVCVPPFRKHGFRTVAGEVFHGLSVQFEGSGLYEDEGNERVRFGGASSLRELDALNEAMTRRHGENTLFRLFASGRLQNEPRLRDRFVSALYIWSGYFQRMIHVRQALCADPALREEYGKHFQEEYGHDRLLQSRYRIDTAVYDPALEAACNWFVAQMQQLDEAQKIVVVHMVVESSGHLFGNATADLFGTRDVEGDYFDVHAEADDDHRLIGRKRLEALPQAAFPALLDTCRRAWDQMDLIHERIAAWTLGQA